MTRVVLFVLFVLAAEGRADTSARAKADATAAYAEGQRRYLAEDYEGAAQQFITAYGLDPDPAYLFNIAQAYRFAKQCALSVRYYRRFLAAVRNPPNKAEVTKYIAEQDACARTQPPPVPDPEPEPKKEPEPKREPMPDPKPDPPPEPIKIDKGGEQRDPGTLRKRLAIGAFAAGAIGVAIGVRYAFRIESLENEREGLCPDLTEPCANLMIDDARLAEQAATAQKYMITGFVVGGVAIASGMFLYVTGRQRSERVAVTPTRGGAFLSLTFSR
jgi:tetratricopeptide (TPR) repeat protein